MNTVVAVILAKERRMVARVRAAGAIDHDHARTLEQLGIKPGVILRRLRERAVIRQAEAGHFYLDEESWTAVRRQRRRAVSVIVAIALAIAFALLFTRRAHAQPQSGRIYFAHAFPFFSADLLSRARRRGARSNIHAAEHGL
jgi:hypothetical protein